MQSKSPGGETSSGEQAPSMTHGQAIAMLVAVIVGVSIYVVPLGMVGIKDVWCGFLFLLYWSKVEHMDNKRIIPTLLGGLFGLGMAYMFATLPTALGPALGWSIATGVVIVVVYCLLMGWLSTFINTPAMLFLTVGAAPEMLHHADFSGAVIALVVGVAFFAGVANLGMYFVSRRAANRTQSAQA